MQLRGHRRFVALPLLLAFSLCPAGVASAHRSPTRSETRQIVRAADRSPLTELVRGEFRLHAVVVSTKGPWARADLSAKPRYEEAMQGSLGVFRRTPGGGWNLKDLGTSEVGCTVGMSRLIEADLRLVCPDSADALSAPPLSRGRRGRRRTDSGPPPALRAHGTREDRKPRAGSIYFWANLNYPVSTPVHGFPNPFVIRPRTFIIFEDGSWEIEKLQWTGWGSAVAKAKGISNADNDIPNVAEGKRVRTPARVTLSDPGLFHGKRVYRCIAMKLRPPARFERACLQRTGNSIGLSPPGSGSPVGTESGSGLRHLTDFLSPDKRVWCTFGDGSGSCNSFNPKSGAQLSADMSKSGKVTTCSVAVPSLSEICFQQFDDSAPVLLYGEQTVAADIRCTSAENGITCVTMSGAEEGNGFRINKDGVVGVE